MPDFGFDPFRILTEARANEAQSSQDMRTLSDLFTQRQNRETSAIDAQTKQAGLQQLLDNQQRVRSLRDIVSENPDSFGGSPLAQALARGGFAQEAFDAQGQAFDARKRESDFQNAAADHVAAQLSTIKPENYPAYMSRLSPGARFMLNLPDEYDKEKVDGYVKSRLSVKDQQELANKGRQLDIDQQKADAENWVPIKDMFGNTVRLMNKKTGETMGAAGGAPAQTSPGGAGKTGGAGASHVKVPPGMAQTSLDDYANNANITGEMPKSLPRGAAGMMYQTAIRERAKELREQAGDTRELGEIAASYQADKSALHHMQTQADTINSYTRTFDKNIGVAQAAMDKLESSNYPLLNKGLRTWEGFSGNPDATSLYNALNTVRSEAAKINSGSTGAGGAPITVLQEMEKGLPDNATPAQTLAAFKVYLQDSKNRRDAMSEQMDEIKGRLGGKKAGAKGSGASSPPPGKVHISNGKEAFWVTPDDAKAAASEGFKVVP